MLGICTSGKMTIIRSESLAFTSLSERRVEVGGGSIIGDLIDRHRAVRNEVG